MDALADHGPGYQVGRVRELDVEGIGTSMDVMDKPSEGLVPCNDLIIERLDE
jgi:hypothetical protein